MIYTHFQGVDLGPFLRNKCPFSANIITQRRQHHPIQAAVCPTQVAMCPTVKLGTIPDLGLDIYRSGQLKTPPAFRILSFCEPRQLPAPDFIFKNKVPQGQSSTSHYVIDYAHVALYLYLRPRTGKQAVLPYYNPSPPSLLH
jgi:hypothetical protein